MKIPTKDSPPCVCAHSGWADHHPSLEHNADQRAIHTGCARCECIVYRDGTEQGPVPASDTMTGPADFVDPALPLGTLVEVRGSATAPDGTRGLVRSLPNADGIVLIDHVDSDTRYGVHARNLTPVPAAVPTEAVPVPDGYTLLAAYRCHRCGVRVEDWIIHNDWHARRNEF